MRHKSDTQSAGNETDDPKSGDFSPGHHHEEPEPAPDAPPGTEADSDEVSKDKLFKTVFRLFFKDLVEIVDPELAAGLDLDHPVFLSNEVFVHFKRYGHVEPDLVAQVATLAGDPDEVLLHFEIENKKLETIGKRLKRYSLQIELELELSVYSNAVFLTGGTPGVQSQESCVAVGTREESNSFSYRTLGLSKCLAEEWVERPQPLAAALAAWMRSKTWDKVEKKLQCLKAIRRADLSLDRTFVLVTVVESGIDLNREEEERYQALVREQAEEVYEMVVTWEEALAEREARGEARGKLEAIRQAIAQLAKHRCGSLPLGFEKQLEAIDEPNRLYEILEAVSEARSLEELEEIDLTPRRSGSSS